jgi:hypothetical protein
MRDTIDMAREVGLLSSRANLHGIYAEALEHLAQLVRADERSVEREACAKVCDDAYAEYPEENQDYAFALAAQQLATTIRARGDT